MKRQQKHLLNQKIYKIRRNYQEDQKDLIEKKKSQNRKDPINMR